MSEKVIDTHTHYFHKRFDSGRDEIIRDLAANNVLAVIEGAIDYASNHKMKLLCEKYPYVYMAAGCHPNCVEDMDEDRFQEIAKLTDYEKVIAIGETGLDYVRCNSVEQISLQKEWFRRFIELAIEKQKNLLIHCRDAYDEMIRILRDYRFEGCPGVIHCFCGNIEQAGELIDMGFYLGVTGMFTKMDSDAELCAALKTIPLDKIVFETDSPYLIPEGVEGKRNTSKNLDVIVREFAKLRDISPEYIREIVMCNTKRLYPELIEE